MLELWSTTVGEYIWGDAPAHNPRLAADILSHATRLDADRQGKTYPELTHIFEEGRFAALDIRPSFSDSFWQFLCAAVSDYLGRLRPGRYEVHPEHITSIWPNVNHEGQYHRPHRHNAVDHVLAGTYYVQVPPLVKEGEGALSLLDPRNGIGGSNTYRWFFNDGEVRLKPEPGYLVLFPPHVLHYVAPHDSEVPRISISFNVTIGVVEGMRRQSAARFAPTGDPA
jgi:uncharacterized protein (TIGR02466 family)